LNRQDAEYAKIKHARNSFLYFLSVFIREISGFMILLLAGGLPRGLRSRRL